jgi:hypothetical protein
MKRPLHSRGPTPHFRSVAFLGLLVLACVGYVACGGSERNYGTPHKGSGGNEDASLTETGGMTGTGNAGSGAAGKNAGGSGQAGASGSGGTGKAGSGGTTGGGTGDVGATGTDGATAGNGTGASKDASDDGPTSNGP